MGVRSDLGRAISGVSRRLKAFQRVSRRLKAFESVRGPLQLRCYSLCILQRCTALHCTALHCTALPPPWPCTRTAQPRTRTAEHGAEAPSTAQDRTVPSGAEAATCACAIRCP